MKILFFITTVVFTLGSCNSSTNTNSTNSYKEDQYEKIGHTADNGELPKKAKDFLNAHFTDQKVKNVHHKKSPVAYGTFFEVELSDRTEVDFDKDGNWKEISNDRDIELPTLMLPDAIQKYLDTHYATIGVTSIDKDETGYELELINDVDLSFDLSGVFLRESR
ncbi:PepSY-like domain-containing protein [Sphingobacterium arenae]|uniref:PepSY-like domain-containing protein n=1 Tax=Sphingobacterium arenae TaxID=1280598 RepID=A0ABR7Y5E4_9SPHI|nr:PepSY-like domain-containing protein [Sphingobacterium arenae]MBD1426494.1 PepSY-like domain-containing protein [Sphingobacterium arenae]